MKAPVKNLFCFQAEDGIRDLVRSRGLGDVYKRQGQERLLVEMARHRDRQRFDWTVIALRDRGTLAATLSLIHI